MEKIAVRINPLCNNIHYITSQINLASGANMDIDFYVLGWKLSITENYTKLNIFSKSKTVIDEWKSCLLLEFENISDLIKHIANFCRKSYNN